MQREIGRGIRGGVAVALLVAARNGAAGAKTEAAEGNAAAVGTVRAAHGIRRNTGATQHQPDAVHHKQHKTCLSLQPLLCLLSVKLTSQHSWRS